MCSAEFEILPEDISFYEKIEVPEPTFCPRCRMQRRFTWRNERTLYKRKCDATKESLISVFPEDSPFTVYSQKYWWSDEWDSLEQGREYDFSKPFFQQFRELMEAVPLQALFNTNAVRSEYCNHSLDNKDSYLSFGSTFGENVNYSNRVAKCVDSYDLYIGHKAEQCYDSLYLENCIGLRFSQHSKSCLNSWFLFDCQNCSDCFGCVGLKNKQYHIFNEPYSKEEYEKKISKYIGSYSGVQRAKEEFQKFLLTRPHRHAHLINAKESTGEYLENIRNSKHCFDIINGMENSKYCTWGGYGWKDSYDGMGVGVAELMYEVVDAGGAGGSASSRTLFSVVTSSASETRYSYACHSTQNVFGCIGLRGKEYCILNKQYSKEEYEALLPKIIQHMNEMPYEDSGGRKYKYGEFFPSEISPFAYNETIAQEYYPLTREEAEAGGLRWQAPDTKEYSPEKLSEDLLDRIEDTDSSYAGIVVGCAHASDKESECSHNCATAFKVLDKELEFYQAMNIPFPRLCPNCRHFERLALRNPLRLWKRRCDCKATSSHAHGNEPCSKEFETTYSPEQKEIIYCEDCYQAEFS
ncbi:hypothetical protein CL629_02675 [bacterium]|nr:hypothetical protein [bacterium]